MASEDQLDFTIDGPDGDGFVWLHWREAGEKRSLNLGRYDCVAEAFGDWLGQTDFGEGVHSRAAVSSLTYLPAEN